MSEGQYLGWKSSWRDVWFGFPLSESFPQGAAEIKGSGIQVTTQEITQLITQPSRDFHASKSADTGKNSWVVNNRPPGKVINEGPVPTTLSVYERPAADTLLSLISARAERIK